MKIDKFEDALRQIRDTHFTNLDLVFEEAYCLYRLDRPEDSLAVLEKSSNPTDKIKELKAMVYYRLEMYEDSYNLYKDILKNTINEELEAERMTNLQAASVYVKASQPVAEQDHSYEMCYNIACQLLAQGKFLLVFDIFLLFVTAFDYF